MWHRFHADLSNHSKPLRQLAAAKKRMDALRADSGLRREVLRYGLMWQDELQIERWTPSGMFADLW
eukprot:SAG31_NODE_5590_length_2438_cov_1.289867_1_plen_66_part_00